MNDTAVPREPSDGLDWTGERRVGGPVDIAWREGTLTRAKESRGTVRVGADPGSARGPQCPRECRLASHLRSEGSGRGGAVEAIEEMEALPLP